MSSTTDFDDNVPVGPIKSIEGWIIFISGVNEEAGNEDIRDRFSEFGEISNIRMPLNRQTGYVQGYCILEYANKSEAESAITDMDGTTFMDRELKVDWAFKRDK